MKRIILPITTASNGTGSASGDSVLGLLYAVQLVDGDFADGVDLALTAEQGDLSIQLLTYANFNTDQIVYPRVLENLNTDGTTLSTHTMPMIAGSPKAAITNGGDTKSGKVILYIMEA